MAVICAEQKMSQYGVFSGLYFPVFSPNKGTHGPEKTQYLNTFNFLESSSNVLKRNYQGKKILALPYFIDKWQVNIYIYIYTYIYIYMYIFAV